jgi:hypothetical protein
MTILSITYHMSDGDISNRVAVLTTGARVLLQSVAVILMSLETLNAGTPEERVALLALRKACLADKSTIPTSASTLLRGAGLIEGDQLIPPAVRQVVLAAVQGEGDGIHIASPYTDLLDRAISDLTTSLAKVEAVLPLEQLATLLQDMPGGVESWVQRIKRANGSGTGFPPPSSN